MRKISYLFILPLILLMSCAKDQNTKDDEALRKYISAHQLTAVSKPNGLYYVETQAGTGTSPTYASQVKVNYKGYFTTGVIFDQNQNGPVWLTLSQTVAGWQEGLPLMKVGGKATLLIPSLLGYGASGAGSIPPNSVLIFDIELIDVR